MSVKGNTVNDYLPLLKRIEDLFIASSLSRIWLYLPLLKRVEDLFIASSLSRVWLDALSYVAG